MVNYELILRKIQDDPLYIEGIKYGKPRKGHAEGTIQAHIADLEVNLDRLSDTVTAEEYWKLKVLIHTHDTMKKWAVRNSPIDDFNSHSSLAKAFLEKFLDRMVWQNEDLLNMVQWHDENFALWKQLKNKGKYDKQRFFERVLAIKDMELFLIFTLIDGFTPSKMALAEQEKPEKIRWFVEEVRYYRELPRMELILGIFDL